MGEKQRVKVPFLKVEHYMCGACSTQQYNQTGGLPSFQAPPIEENSR